MVSGILLFRTALSVFVICEVPIAQRGSPNQGKDGAKNQESAQRAFGPNLRQLWTQTKQNKGEKQKLGPAVVEKIQYPAASGGDIGDNRVYPPTTPANTPGGSTPGGSSTGQTGSEGQGSESTGGTTGKDDTGDGLE